MNLTQLSQRWTALQENPFWVMEVRKRARQGLWRGRLSGLLTQGAFVCFPILMLSVWESPLTLAVIMAHLQILFLACRATASTATSVVNERHKGTLLSIALTKLNSADYADGVALSSAHRYITNFTAWMPLTALLSWFLGGGLAPAFGLWIIGVLVTLLSCYSGVQISATSKDSQQANQRALSKPLITLCGLPLLFPLGGFIALPLWLAHPFGALDLALFGFDSPLGGVQHFLAWKGWALIFAAVYAVCIVDTRRRAITSLERARLL